MKHFYAGSTPGMSAELLQTLLLHSIYSSKPRKQSTHVGIEHITDTHAVQRDFKTYRSALLPSDA